MAAKRGPKTPMTDEHKAALAQGRNEARAVKVYLEAIAANKPKRGRKRTTESITKRLNAIASEVGSASPLSKLELVQERMDLQAELETMDQIVDLSGLEAEFVNVAAVYGGRKGISYSAWREIGVDAAVLKLAGIGRGA